MLFAVRKVDSLSQRNSQRDPPQALETDFRPSTVPPRSLFKSWWMVPFLASPSLTSAFTSLYWDNLFMCPSPLPPKAVNSLYTNLCIIHLHSLRWLGGKECTPVILYLWSGDVGLIPGQDNPSWSRKWQPTPVFLPGKSHGQRSLAATVHRVPKSYTWLNTHTRENLKTHWWSIRKAFLT